MSDYVGKRLQRKRFRRHRAHLRVRARVQGTAERPRLVVYRSLRNMEAQLVDDEAGRTMLGMSTLAPEMKDFSAEGKHKRVEQAHAAGKLLGERAKAQGIESVVFDRGGYKYHGRVKAFADGAREGGLQF